MATIRVPQADDEIRISRNGDIDTAAVYEVHDHLVDVPADDVDHFLSVIDGAELEGVIGESGPEVFVPDASGTVKSPKPKAGSAPT